MNLQSLATITTLVATAVGGTWVALTSIHEKIDETQDKKDHPHFQYITREEYRMHADRMYESIEKIDSKLDKVMFFHGSKKVNFTRLEKP